MKSTILFFILSILCNNSVWTQESDDSRILKILSFNIYHGETMKGDFDLDVIANVIHDADPDFVALQEVDFKTKRAKNYDLTTELRWRAQMVPIFARAMKFDGGEYGEGVSSKYSFIHTRNVSMPYSTGNEPRAAMEITTILDSGDTISFVGTHLAYLIHKK